MFMTRVFDDIQQAIADIEDGASVMVGGFGLCGIPENLIRALRDRGTRNLILISNNASTDNAGVGLLLRNSQVKRMIATDVGEDPFFERLVLNGQVQIELSPQGTFAERIRTGGAGLGGFYTPTGYGTIAAENKETRTWNGRHYVLELPLRAQFALVKAWRGDRAGNLVYRATARNLNPLMATAADVTIAEVEELAEPGQLDPDSIHTPGIYVQRILQGVRHEKYIERKRGMPLNAGQKAPPHRQTGSAGD
jgi:3-oxoacid CoA-transferase subunit A